MRGSVESVALIVCVPVLAAVNVTYGGMDTFDGIVEASLLALALTLLAFSTARALLALVLRRAPPAHDRSRWWTRMAAAIRGGPSAAPPPPQITNPKEWRMAPPDPQTSSSTTWSFFFWHYVSRTTLRYPLHGHAYLHSPCAPAAAAPPLWVNRRERDLPSAHATVPTHSQPVTTRTVLARAALEPVPAPPRLLGVRAHARF